MYIAIFIVVAFVVTVSSASAQGPADKPCERYSWLASKNWKAKMKISTLEGAVEVTVKRVDPATCAVEGTHYSTSQIANSGVLQMQAGHIAGQKLTYQIGRVTATHDLDAEKQTIVKGGSEGGRIPASYSDYKAEPIK